jgi:hypothetical protein
MNNVHKEPHFAGTVTQVYDNAILVSVKEGEDARRSSDLISVSLKVKLKDSMRQFMIGDEVIVYYNGEIAESYPAQANTVYAIVLTSPDMRVNIDGLKALSAMRISYVGDNSAVGKMINNKDNITGYLGTIGLKWEDFQKDWNGSVEKLFASLPAVTYEPRKWVDFYRDEELPQISTYDLMLDEFPGVMFSWTSGKVTATDSNGIKDLFKGMPVWNVYLADLNGDGLPELCATVSVGSGMVDTRVIVYDYANEKLFDLSDRGYYDYSLSIEGNRIVVTQTGYFKNGSQAIGSMAIIDGELVTFGIDRTLPEMRR